MNVDPLRSLIESVSVTLGVPTATTQAIRFLDCFEHGSTFWECDNAVSPHSPPFEFSFSGRDELPSLRLLGEVIQAGESLVSRCSNGLATLGRLHRSFFNGGLDQPALLHQAALLLPPSEEFGHLDWPYVLWFALRTDGVESEIRCYFNMQWRQWGHRLIRAKNFLTSTGNSRCNSLIDILAKDLSSWAAPVGLCFDLNENGVVPARMHFSLTSTPVRKMHDVLDHLDMADKLDEVFDFLGVFESSFPKSSQPPVLLSVSLDEDRPGIKLDVTMDSLDLSVERADLLSACESRYGKISGFRKAGHLFQSAHGSALRYVGLSMQRGCKLVPKCISELSACLRGARALPKS